MNKIASNSYDSPVKILISCLSLIALRSDNKEFVELLIKETPSIKCQENFIKIFEEKIYNQLEKEVYLRNYTYICLNLKLSI